MDNRLVFVWENQGVWVAATAGIKGPFQDRTMRISDYEGAYNANDTEKIDAVLRKRYGKDAVNEFWIWRGYEEYPVIGLLVRGDMAAPSYFPRDGHPGYVSVGDLRRLRLHPGEKTTFFVNTPTEPIWVVNEHVIPFADALRAVHEFRANPALPKSIRWFEL